jgi:type II secretory pathway pseudopilin PulG
MAMVLTIVTFLLAGLLRPLGTYVDKKNKDDTKLAIDEIKEALIGFAIGNRRLPCPDTDADGVGQPISTANPGGSTVAGPAPGQSTKLETCPADEGWLPAVDLGIGAQDSWGNRYRYRVNTLFSRLTTVFNTATPTTIYSETGFGFASTGNINVRTRGDNPATGGVVEAKFLANMTTNVPALLISHGPNGLGATKSDGTANPAPTTVDELDNTDLNQNFTSRLLTADSTGCSDTVEGQPFCVFDDIVVPLSRHILVNRMVAAGRLP